MGSPSVAGAPPACWAVLCSTVGKGLGRPEGQAILGDGALEQKRQIDATWPAEERGQKTAVLNFSQR